MKSTAVCSLAMQQVASNMVTSFPPEVFKQRDKIVNETFKDRICVLEKVWS